MNFEEEFKQLQLHYLETLPEKLEQIEGCILELEQGKQEGLRMLLADLHTLKGTAGSYGFSFMVTICHKFEDDLAVQRNQNKFNTDLNLKLVDLMKDYTSRMWKTELKLEESEFNDKLSELIGKNTAKEKGHILIIEPMKTLRKSYTEVLQALGHSYSFASSAYVALGRMLHEDFDGLITSYESGKITGDVLAQTIKAIPSIKKDFKTVLVSSKDFEAKPEGVDLVVKKSPQLPQQLKEFFG